MNRVKGQLLAVVLLGVCACQGGKPVGELTGVVKYKGQILTSGTVTVTGADDARSHSAIGSEGQYRVRGVRAGSARIAVVSHPRVPSGLAKPGAPPAEAQKPQSGQMLPDRYASPDTSGLTLDVRGGKQLHDIDLEP